MRDAAVLVELGVVAILDDATLANRQPRLVDDGARQEIDIFIIRRDFASGILEHLRFDRRERRRDRRQHLQRQLQRNQVARIRRADLDARQKALEITDLGKRRTQGVAQREVLDELLHGIEPHVDGDDGQQRRFQPFLEQAAAHGRLREIKHIEQRVLLAAIAQVARDFEVTQRIRIDGEVLARVEARQVRELREVGLDRLVQVVEQRRDGRFCLRLVRTVGGVEMLDDAVVDMRRVRHVRDRRIRAGAKPQVHEVIELRTERQVADEQQLRHLEAVELIEQRLQAVRACIDAIKTFARRDVRARKHDHVVLHRRLV